MTTDSGAAPPDERRGQTAERLATYRSKRQADATPEPFGDDDAPAGRSAPLFVIQEHHARARHFDFRLEHEGVLVSWALPKGVPLSTHENHLAVPTEDHPLSYANFEGSIPKGQYGGGEVRIWDRGSFEAEKWTDREIKVVLHGQRVNGRYVLFPTGERRWMIHLMASDPTPTPPVPFTISPMLALAGDLPKDDAGWAYEFKWDGVRAIVYLEQGALRALTRNSKELAPAFPELGSLAQHFAARSVVLDGELVAFDPDSGRPSFGRLQQRLHLGSSARISTRAREVPVTFVAFDVLRLDNTSLLEESYDERRKTLEALGLSGEGFVTSPSFSDRAGADVLEASRAAGLEGVVAKRRDAPYRPGGRGGDWIKVKNFRTQEVVIGGWTEGRGERATTLGALLLGVNDTERGGLVYVGKVGTGFTEAQRKELLGALRRLEQPQSPFDEVSLRTIERGAHFVQPELVGEVRYGEWTRDGHLRHPTWRGMRPDKDARSVTREA